MSNKGVIHFICRDLDTEQQLLSQLRALKEKEPSLFKGYYIICSYKGEVEIEPLEKALIEKAHKLVEELLREGVIDKLRRKLDVRTR